MLGSVVLGRRVRRPPEQNEHRGVDFGWRVHTAQESWTAKVDAKAAIFFTVEMVLLAAVLAGHGHGKIIDRVHGGWRIFAEVGSALSLVSAVLAGSTVFPFLGRTRVHMRQYSDHLIYFGHLRHWKPTELTVRLARLTASEELEQLGLQLVEMSRINWRKHRRL